MNNLERELARLLAEMTAAQAIGNYPLAREKMEAFQALRAKRDKEAVGQMEREKGLT